MFKFMENSLISIRNKLCNLYPYFRYSCIDNKNNYIETQLRHDTNSYSCNVYDKDVLTDIRTGRYDFSQVYNIKFDKDGKRIYTVFVNDSQIILNHRNCQVNINFDDEDDIKITIKRKGVQNV